MMKTHCFAVYTPEHSVFVEQQTKPYISNDVYLITRLLFGKYKMKIITNYDDWIQDYILYKSCLHLN